MTERRRSCEVEGVADVFADGSNLRAVLDASRCSTNLRAGAVASRGDGSVDVVRRGRDARSATFPATAPCRSRDFGRWLFVVDFALFRGGEPSPGIGGKGTCDCALFGRGRKWIAGPSDGSP